MLKTNLKLLHGVKGQLRLYLSFFVVLLLALGLTWFYLRTQAAFGGLNLPFAFLQQAKFTDTTGWKEFKTDDRLTILYPADWFIFDRYISQYPYTPGKVSNDVYNAITAQQITTQLQNSYANEDWFNLLYNAKVDESVVNEFRPSDQNRFIKVGSGRTKNGDRFVLYQESRTNNLIKAYLIHNLVIYQFNLESYDKPGVEFFKQIISTATFN